MRTACFLVLVALAQAARADTQDFTVNAQYRGAVKKAFMGIGSGTLRDDARGNSFRLTGRADVDHPREKGRHYNLRIDMSFRLKRGVLEETANNSTCNRGSEEALSTTMKIAPFVHLAKWLPSDDTGRTIVTPRGQFELRFGRTDRHLEITLLERGRMAGKFFMEPTDNVPRRMEKFRIVTSGGTVLSFVAGPAVASR